MIRCCSLLSASASNARSLLLTGRDFSLLPHFPSPSLLGLPSSRQLVRCMCVALGSAMRVAYTSSTAVADSSANEKLRKKEMANCVKGYWGWGLISPPLFFKIQTMVWGVSWPSLSWSNTLSMKWLASKKNSTKHTELHLNTQWVCWTCSKLTPRLFNVCSKFIEADRSRFILLKVRCGWSILVDST